MTHVNFDIILQLDFFEYRLLREWVLYTLAYETLQV